MIGIFKGGPRDGGRHELRRFTGLPDRCPDTVAFKVERGYHVYRLQKLCGVPVFEGGAAVFIYDGVAVGIPPRKNPG